jgi:hypothetical protein
MVINSTGVVSVSLPTVEESRMCMGVFNLRLPSNDGLQSNTSHCSLPKAIRPEWPNGITIRSFLTCLWSSLHGGCSPAAHQWFNPRSGCSPAVPAPPSLRPLVSSGPLMRCDRFRVPIHFYSFFLLLEGPMLQCFLSLRCPDLFLALGRWPDLPKCPLDFILYSSRGTNY